MPYTYDMATGTKKYAKITLNEAGARTITDDPWKDASTF